MHWSRYLLPTLKELPSGAEVQSHRLMLRAGMIRLVASGVYEFLPLGLRVLRTVEGIVREEMDRAGGLEIRLPILQPAELWQTSGRWEDFGPEMFKLVDRKEQAFALGPTHEEITTDLARREIRSYRDLPLLLYQINEKYRDEIRPPLRAPSVARVPDEGRLQLPRDKGEPPGDVSGDGRGLPPHLRMLPPRLRRNRGLDRPDGR
jgi:prolyl-tRNA synthetase